MTYPSQTLIPIDHLEAHPANSNVMPKALVDKLANEIKRTGLYPPIIVRPVGERYQVLDGHHRVSVLRELGHDRVQAVVWDVNDEQALLLLATLNRLSGSDDPRRRASLVVELSRTIETSELVKRLPENAEKVRQLIKLHAAPPSPKMPDPIEEMPVAVHFFLLPSQRRAVETRLREHGGPRETALLSLLGILEENPDE